ncbi:MAG: signal peptidase I [Gammaproteobacteria bacterium]
MNFNFSFILTSAVIIMGLIALIDYLWLSKKREKTAKIPAWIEHSRSLFPVLLFVLVVRSFIAEPFRIPSGSLEPTLLIGDFVLVNKFEYGLRLPVLEKKAVKISEPKVGDIVVFHYPPNPSVDYIKRVVGVPGDHIRYINKVLYINNKPMDQKFLGYSMSVDANGERVVVKKMQENLLGTKHNIFIDPEVAAQDKIDIIVPPGKYFMMGDNRDESYDSRYWGFVPEQNLIGKAFLVWFSWNKTNNSIRFSRIGLGVTS